MKVNIDLKTKYPKCHAIIHSASLAAAAVGAGFAQIPVADSVALTQIQTAMAMALGRHFGIDLTESLGTAGISTVAATALGRTASKVIVGWIPVVGNVVNATTAAAITETMGWLLVEDFSEKVEGVC